MSMNKVIHTAVRRDLDRFLAALDAFTEGDAARAAGSEPGLGQLRRHADRPPRG